MNPLPSWALPLLLVVALALAVSIGAVEVHNVFADLKGDGRVDLLTSSPGAAYGAVVSVELIP